MPKLPAEVPSTALSSLLAAIGEQAERPEDLELSIKIKCSGVNARELAAYLKLMDRAYGRIVSENLYSYAGRRDQQIQIDLRGGSIWIIIGTNTGAAATGVAVLWLLLKYLPLAIEKGGRFMFDVTGAFNNIEQGRLARAQRRELGSQRGDRGLSDRTRANPRALIRNDRTLTGLTPERVRQIARLLDKLYGLEEEQLPGATRFTDYHLIQFVLRAHGQEFRNPPDDQVSEG